MGHVDAEEVWNGDIEDVKASVRNQAGELGANAIILENRPPWSDGGSRNRAYGIALRCADK